MKNEKIYIEGYVVGFLSGTDGTREKKIQVISGEIVNIDENFIYKSIEPQKVTIPQYIADKIEYCKESDGWDLFQAMDYCFNFRECSSWLTISDNQEEFALAWIFGYEVEKEPKYIVRLKNARFLYETLNFNKQLKQWYFSDSSESTSYRIKHTRKELEEAGFGWVFDCEGIKIEEVEE